MKKSLAMLSVISAVALSGVAPPAQAWREPDCPRIAAYARRRRGK